MRRKIGFVVFLFFSFSGLLGQINPYGIPEVVNYPPEAIQGSEQNWTVIQDNRGIMYFGSHDKGVLEYDGNNWRSILIPNKSSVRSFACDEDGTIYVGAVAEIGYLEPDISGLLNYRSLLPKLDSTGKEFSTVWKTFCVENKVYFYSEKHIFIYYPEEDSLNYIPVEKHSLFAFYENDKFYTGNFLAGLMVLQGDSALVKTNGGDFYKRKDIYGLTSYDEQRLLVSTDGYGLSLFNTATGEVDTLFASKSTNDFLNENFITHISSLADGKFAISTAGAGIVILNNSGEIANIISKNEGLQNQAVFFAYQNKNNYPYAHLWTSMSLGLGKINIESPIRHFTEQEGYEGLIHAINSIGDRIFIGTGSGLYASSTRNNFASFEKIENITRPVWDLEQHTLSSGEKVLIAIGEGGLMQVHKNGDWINLKDKIQGVKGEENKVFWGYTIYKDPDEANRIFIGMSSSLTALNYEKGKWIQDFSIYTSGEVRSMASAKNNKLWFGTILAGIGYISEFNDEEQEVYFDTSNGLPTKENNYVYRSGDDVLIGTDDGIFKIYDQPDTIYFYPDTLLNSYLPSGRNTVLNIYTDPENTIWISYDNEKSGWNNIGLIPGENSDEYKVISKPFYSLGDFSTDAFHSIAGDDVWFSKSNVLYHYPLDYEFKEGNYSALIRKVTVNEDSVVFNGAFVEKDDKGRLKFVSKQNPEFAPQIKYSDNNIEFRWSAPYFEHEDDIEFSYYLEGFSENWSEWERVFYRPFTNLHLGEYTFKVKAKNIFGDESQIDEFSFEILRPWYLTIVAILLYIVATVAIVYIIIALYTRRLKNENIRLEGIIMERTAEIRKQKEELTDSIEYASRIQRALLPPDQMLSAHELEHFILFKPRDIVSGDFYWIASKKDKLFIVAADCTGHGVPGAFMSMLGISFLDEIVIKSDITETNLILDALKNHVITSLRQTGKGMEESTKDGMDLAMVAIDKKSRAVQYSGAYNPLYAVRELSEEEKAILTKGEELELERGSVHNDTHLLYQVKADPMPIGISEKDMKFTAKLVDDINATIYLFSDGFVDQFGGPAGKKFMSKSFKKLLLDIQDLPMEEQGERLDDALMNWMADVEQIDDILVIGLKLKRK